MSTLLYLHGFDSSPGSRKAVILQQWVQLYRPDIELLIPQLPYFPEQVSESLEHIMFDRVVDKFGIIGSSLGGFYATWLSQCFTVPAVLVNPLVKPAEYLTAFLGQQYQTHFGEQIVIDQQHLEDFQTLELPFIESPDLIWLLAQQGDEVLPYQQAAEYYSSCRQTIEPSGNHSFVGFENYLPDIIDFLGL
ncbi:esterase YqiA [Utexia brackfieldae]|uniref:esterase YqiA n=1 Tax=Utexia brackfieldae TaxID=3074108 RepID=UPI00370D3AD7